MYIGNCTPYFLSYDTPLHTITNMAVSPRDLRRATPVAPLSFSKATDCNINFGISIAA